MTDERVYLVYILDSIANIHELTAQGEAALNASRHDRAAVLYYLHTLAEATQRLSETTKAHYQQIPWIAIGDFRNRLVHGYLDINWQVVWNIIDNSLQPLKEAVEAMMRELDKNTPNPSEK